LFKRIAAAARLRRFRDRASTRIKLRAFAHCARCRRANIGKPSLTKVTGALRSHAHIAELRDANVAM
jgi:hypothetical protein